MIERYDPGIKNPEIEGNGIFNGIIKKIPAKESKGNSMNTVKNLGKKLQFGRFLKEEDGAGVVEVILILVVIIGLVLIFKEQLNDLVDKIFSKIQRNANSV